MVLDSQTAILLIVFLVTGGAVLICCIYCCPCKSAWTNFRRRLTARQLARDQEAIEQERQTDLAYIRETTSANGQARYEIRNKYQLR